MSINEGQINPIGRRGRITQNGYNSLVEALNTRASTQAPQIPSTGRFVALVQSQGPSGQPDFCPEDPRYWVREAFPTKVEAGDPPPPMDLPEGEDPPSGADCPLAGGTGPDPRFIFDWDYSPNSRYVQAINLQEIGNALESRDDLLPEGTPVECFIKLDADGRAWYSFLPLGGAGGGPQPKQAFIERAVIDGAADLDQSDMDALAAIGPHLRMIERRGGRTATTAQFLLDAPIRVMPNYNRVTGEFLNEDLSQIWDPIPDGLNEDALFTLLEDRTTYEITKQGQFWVMQFGEGEDWHPQPDETCLCSAGTGPCGLVDEDDGGGSPE